MTTRKELAEWYEQEAGLKRNAARSYREQGCSDAADSRDRMAERYEQTAQMLRDDATELERLQAENAALRATADALRQREASRGE